MVAGGEKVIGNAVVGCAQLVKHFEALELAPYLCPAGKLTVGYGHVILPSEDYLKDGVTRSQAESLLMVDLAWSLREVHLCSGAVTAYQAAALGSLVYNIGLAAWRKSTIRVKVAAMDYPAAAKEFLRWKYIKGDVSAGLLRRRVAEKMIFEGGSLDGLV